MGMDRKIEKKKWSPKKVAQLGAVAVFGLFIIYMFAFRSGGSSLNVKKDRITLSIVKEGPFQELIPVIGNVLPHTTIYLDAVLGGRVETIYLEAGSGAAHPVGLDMIQAIRRKISLPLIVGGGISSTDSARYIYNSGADLIVVGSAIEKDPTRLKNFIALRDEVNAG